MLTRLLVIILQYIQIWNHVIHLKPDNLICQLFLNFKKSIQKQMIPEDF